MQDKNEKDFLRWADNGWLASPEYLSFWGSVFSSDLVNYVDNKTIADIGAGNGQIWEYAIQNGCLPKALHLIDPDLYISNELENYRFVQEHKDPIEDVSPLHIDTAICKQSFHIIYEYIGNKFFDLVNAEKYIIFSMPKKISWAVSDAFEEIFLPSCLDVEKAMKENGKKTVSSNIYSYPVKLPRHVWISMVKGRFTSCLHPCDDEFIENEVAWIEANLPETIEFDDKLECIIFE